MQFAAQCSNKRQPKLLRRSHPTKPPEQQTQTAAAQLLQHLLLLLLLLLRLRLRLKKLRLDVAEII